MCGRFTLTTADAKQVADMLGASLLPDHATGYKPRYNIAPGDVHFVLVAQAARVMMPARWGMPGPWVRKLEPNMQGFANARAETAWCKRAFADAFVSQRCGVIADGFFEWTGPKKERQPLWFHGGGRILVFAGLFRDVLDSATGEVLRHFTILTTEANDEVAPYHDRMPVILPPSEYDSWLSPEPCDSEASRARLHQLLEPAPAGTLEVTPVSRRVNSTRYDDPECLVPVSLPRQEPLL